MFLCIGSLVMFSNAQRPSDYFTHIGIDTTILFLAHLASAVSVRYRLESYIDSHSDARFSHSICPNCLTKALDDNGLE